MDLRVLPGGRYIVPIDWIVILYFLIGVFQAITLAANSLGLSWDLFTEPCKPHPPKRNFTAGAPAGVIAILAILFGVGALVPLAERLHGSRYQSFDISKVLADHQTQLSNVGLNFQEINTFLQNPNAEISVGRALYPRYYIENEGEVHFFPVIKMGFPRITFTLIGQRVSRNRFTRGETTLLSTGS